MVHNWAMPTIQELARNVDAAQAQLDRARDQLLAALSGTPIRRGNAAVRSSGQVRRGPGGDSVSARVLSLVQSSPQGIARADINARFAGEEKAVHSALKMHSAKKRIESVDGLWRAVAVKVPTKPAAPARTGK